MKFYRYSIFSIMLSMLILLSGCGGGACSTNNQDNNQALYTFPNGTQLFGVTSASVEQGDSSQPVQFILKGGSPNLTVTFKPIVNYTLNQSLNKQSSSSGLQASSCILLCASFNPDALVINSNYAESSSNLSLSAGIFMPVGSYTLDVNVDYEYNGVKYYDVNIATVVVNVTSNNINPTPTPVPTPD